MVSPITSVQMNGAGSGAVAGGSGAVEGGSGAACGGASGAGEGAAGRVGAALQAAARRRANRNGGMAGPLGARERGPAEAARFRRGLASTWVSDAELRA